MDISDVCGDFIVWPDWQEPEMDLISKDIHIIYLNLIPPENDATQLLSRDQIKFILHSQNIVTLPVKVSIQSGKVAYVEDMRHLQAQKYDGIDTTSSFQAAMTAYDSFDLFEAAKSLFKVVQKDERHKAALFNLASILHMVELPTLSVYYIELVVRLDPEDMTSHTFLWALANSEEASGAGIDAYRRLADTDLKAAHKLATLTVRFTSALMLLIVGEGASAIAGDPNYAKRIYDDMAERFESKLVDHLGYRGPWILHEMVERSLEKGNGPIVQGPMANWRILDVGCGSGLCGRVFRGATSVDDRQGSGGEIQGEQTDSSDSGLAATHPSSASSIPSPSSESKSSSIDSLVQSAQASLSSPSPLLSVSPPPQPLSPSLTLSVHASVLTPADLNDSAFQTGSLLIGIDISERMAEITLRQGSYDAVVCGDLREALAVFAQGQPPSRPCCSDSVLSSEFAALVQPLDMVIAADTFIYVGVLGAIFALTRAALRENGLFLFSVENLDESPMQINRNQQKQAATSSNGDAEDVSIRVPEDISFDGDEPVGAVPGWGAQLLSSARFAHSHAYIEALCKKHRFHIVEARQQILRHEGTMPLQGIFYALEAVL